MRTEDLCSEVGVSFLPEDLAHEIPRVDVQESEDHKEGVQHTDAREILERPEVGNARFGWRIIYFYRHRCNSNTCPCRPHDHLNFELVLAREKTHTAEEREWVQTIAGLR